MIIASAGTPIEGAVVELTIPKNATTMKRKVLAIHFLFGTEGLAIPVIVQGRRPLSLRQLRGKKVTCAVSFGTHEGKRGRTVDVVMAEVQHDAAPNAALLPQLKYRAVDMIRLDS